MYYLFFTRILSAFLLPFSFTPMKIQRNFSQIVAMSWLPLLLVFVSIRCQQYDYSSPLPGLLSIRLHTIADTTQLAFSPLNNFVLKVTSVNAERSDLAQAPILGDVKAIGRTTSIYNTLDAHAEDSSLVIGEGYLPPGDYLGVLMLIEPGDVIVLDGYRNINVEKPDNFNSTLSFLKPFHINEQQTTRIVLTIDLNCSLVKGAEVYHFNPCYYISSIQTQ